MKISGFSYIRNGFTYGYPFIESIQSILPICDEFIIAVGKSDDGTRAAIENIGSDKISIIDTVWDDNLREGGKIFAQQANIALEQITGDWGFHIQADEVVHEADLPIIKEAIENNHNNAKVDGLLLNFLNFFGSYDYLGVTRKWHRREIRLFKNTGKVRSYRDSQGFRKYPSIEAFENNHPGIKMNVKLIPARIFHYSYTRNPKLMKKKDNLFHSFWHDDKWLQENLKQEDYYDYSVVNGLEPFNGTHPAVMKEVIAKQDWEFTYDPSKTSTTPKQAFLHFVEKHTGWRIGEYQNYRLIK